MGGGGKVTDFTISEARGKEGRDDAFSAQRRARFYIVLGAIGERIMLISTLIFALIAIVLQPIASGVVQEQHVSYLQNIRGSLYLNEISATTLGSLASSSSFNNYQIKRVSYNYLVIRAIFDEPMYLHTDRGAGDSNLDQPTPLGKHKDGDLQNAVQIRCGHSVYRSNVDFSTTSRIHFAARLCLIKLCQRHNTPTFPVVCLT